MVSFLLSPLVGMFVVAMSPVRKETLETETVVDVNYPKEDGMVNFIYKNDVYIFSLLIVVFVIYLILHTSGEQPMM